MSTQPSLPTQVSRGARSKTAIERAAIRLLGRRGYRGTSLAAIAASVDMSQPGVLHHFPTKEHLLLQILRQRDHEDFRRVGSALTEEGLRLLPALRSLVEHNQTTRELVQLFTVLLGESVGGDHPAHGHFVDRYRTIRGLVRSSLEQGQRSGEIRADVDLTAAAAVILAVMDGLQIQWLLDPDIDMLAGFQTLSDALTQYLSADARPAAPGRDGSAQPAAD